jgi:hypothetical protein
MTKLLALLVALWALGGLSPATPAGLSLTSLTPHGMPSASDLIPCQPAAGTTMLSCTASDLQNFVVTNLKAYGAVGDGITDDTLALQTAINTGLPLYCPPGVYKTTATLTVSKPANDGQVVRGSGSWGLPDAYNGSTGGGACIIRPSSAVSTVIKIDGTPFTGGGSQLSWVQGFGLENLVIDMTNMTDDAAHIAINQTQAWDVHYDHVRVINDGNYKRAWLLSGGAFTTALNQPYGRIIDLEGTNSTFEVTTITINNPDVLKIIANYTTGVVVNGGAVQHPYTAGVTPIVWIPAGAGPYSFGTNAGGLYMAIGTDIKNSQYFTITGTDFEASSQPPPTCTVGGWAFGTYNDGTHGCGKLLMGALVESTSVATSVTTPAAAGMYFMDQGTGSTFNGLGQSGVAAFAVQGAVQYDLSDLRVAGTLSGPVGFGGALGSETSSSYSIVGSTGAATFHGETVKPSSDGSAVLWRNAANADALNLNTSTNQLNLSNGLGLNGYNDAATTLTWQLSDVSSAGKLVLYNAGAASITLNSNGTIQGASLFATPVGNLSASSGAFTTLSASSTVSGTGFSTYLASPPVIGGTAAAAGTFTTLNATSNLQVNGRVAISATAPTVASGFSTGTPTVTGAATNACTVTLGAAPGSAGVLTMPAATTGWVCMGVDRTTAAGTIRETATGTTSVTFALASTVASDVLQFQCSGY